MLDNSSYKIHAAALIFLTAHNYAQLSQLNPMFNLGVLHPSAQKEQNSLFNSHYRKLSLFIHPDKFNSENKEPLKKHAEKLIQLINQDKNNNDINSPHIDPNITLEEKLELMTECDTIDESKLTIMKLENDHKFTRFLQDHYQEVTLAEATQYFQSIKHTIDRTQSIDRTQEEVLPNSFIDNDPTCFSCISQSFYCIFQSL